MCTCVKVPDFKIDSGPREAEANLQIVPSASGRCLVSSFLFFEDEGCILSSHTMAMTESRASTHCLPLSGTCVPVHVCVRVCRCIRACVHTGTSPHETASLLRPGIMSDGFNPQHFAQSLPQEQTLRKRSLNELFLEATWPLGTSVDGATKKSGKENLVV